MVKYVEPDITLPDVVPDDQVARLQAYVDSLEDGGLPDQWAPIDFERNAFVRAWNATKANTERVPPYPGEDQWRTRGVNYEPVTVDIDIVDAATMDRAVGLVLRRGLSRLSQYERLVQNFLASGQEWAGLQAGADVSTIRSKIREYFGNLQAKWHDVQPTLFEARKVTAMSNWVQIDEYGDSFLWEDDAFTLQVQPADDHDGWVYLVTGPNERERSMETISGNVRPEDGTDDEPHDVTDAMGIAEAVLHNEFGVDPDDYRDDDFVASKDNVVSEYTTGYKQGFVDGLKEATPKTAAFALDDFEPVGSRDPNDEGSFEAYDDTPDGRYVSAVITEDSWYVSIEDMEGDADDEEFRGEASSLEDAVAKINEAIGE